jgi:putative aldouronate transport system substrate-binding protein
MITAYNKFLEAKAFIPLEDLVEKYGPNLKKHYEKYWNLIKYNDGHIYVLPNYGIYQGKYMYNESWGPCFWIQKAVLKEFGYPKVKTLDEYFDLIKKYKDKYPTIDGQPTIGFGILCDGWRNFCLKNAPQHLAGYPNDGNVTVDNNVAHIFADKDIAKRYYKKLNEVYQQGLIDPETFVLNYDQYIAKLSSGRVLGVFDQRWNFQNSEFALKAQDKILRTFAPCPVTFDTSIKDYYLDRPPVNVNCGFGISTKCKNPERIIKLFDTLLTEEWQKILQWGIEGEDYMVDKNGRFYRTPEQRKAQEDPAWRQANMTLEFLVNVPKMEGSYSDGNATSPGMQPEEYYATLRPAHKELLAAYGYKTDGEFFSTPPANAPHYPVWSIPIAEGTPAKITETKLDETSSKYLPQVIKAKPADFEKIWETYVAEIKKLDIAAYEAAVNEGIQKRVSLSR